MTAFEVWWCPLSFSRCPCMPLWNMQMILRHPITYSLLYMRINPSCILECCTPHSGTVYSVTVTFAKSFFCVQGPRALTLRLGLDASAKSFNIIFRAFSALFTKPVAFVVTVQNQTRRRLWSIFSKYFYYHNVKCC